MRELPRKIIFLFCLFAGSLLVSCDSESISSADETFDDNRLISAIENAEQKQLISISQLPAISQRVVAQEYTDSYSKQAYKAEGLGYEVSMRVTSGSDAGEQYSIYFSERGRELQDSNEKEIAHRKKKKGKRGRYKGCFKLVLPVSFTMPDESVITIETPDGWSAIREWYENHPDETSKPDIHFPVDVILRDSTQLSIANIEEMKVLRQNCMEGRRHKGKYTRNIVEEVVFLDDCDFPVSGVVELLNDDNEVVAVIDFGDGT
ncbi:MAG: hypothetical protein MI784_03590, partial [Cytophagales bacterium]|nr:hypothetical protein [Cytophagales bacterium]